MVKTLAAGGVPAGPIPVETLRRRADAAVMVFRLGDRSVVVKAFDPARAATAAPFERELACLLRLERSGLAPRLRGFDRKNRFVLMDEVEGCPLDHALAPATLPAIARRLGTWYARFARAQAAAEHHADWQTYLARYPGLLDPEAPEDHAFLADLPVASLKIARNDAHLGNFLARPGGSLVGLDYEAASLKPQGWDLLLAARDLARRAPPRAAEIVDALLEGWGGGTDSLFPEDLHRLALFFVARTALRSHAAVPAG